jgi:hypothetical protein
VLKMGSIRAVSTPVPPAGEVIPLLGENDSASQRA